MRTLRALTRKCFPINNEGPNRITLEVLKALRELIGGNAITGSISDCLTEFDIDYNSLNYDEQDTIDKLIYPCDHCGYYMDASDISCLDGSGLCDQCYEYYTENEEDE